MSPSTTIDVLLNLAKVVKDFCGVLNEEALRKNFVLVYEIIDEMLDFGYPQSTSTEQVRPYIVNEVVPVTPSKAVRTKTRLFSTATSASINA